MKKVMKLFAAAFIATVLAACTTDVPISSADANRPIEFTQQLPGMSRNEIYLSTGAWITETFMLGRATVLEQNREAGYIKLKAHIPYPCYENCDNSRNIQFTMQFKIKDGSLRLSFAHIRLRAPQSKDGVPIALQKDLNVIKSEFARLNKGLHASLMGDESTTFIRGTN